MKGEECWVVEFFNKNKRKDKIFSKYPCVDYLHNALEFISDDKPDVAYEEICWALLKASCKLSDKEQKTFNDIRERQKN